MRRCAAATVGPTGTTASALPQGSLSAVSAPAATEPLVQVRSASASLPSAKPPGGITDHIHHEGVTALVGPHHVAESPGEVARPIHGDPRRAGVGVRTPRRTGLRSADADPLGQRGTVENKRDLWGKDKSPGVVAAVGAVVNHLSAAGLTGSLADGTDGPLPRPQVMRGGSRPARAVGTREGVNELDDPRSRRERSQVRLRAPPAPGGRGLAAVHAPKTPAPGALRASHGRDAADPGQLRSAGSGRPRTSQSEQGGSQRCRMALAAWLPGRQTCSLQHPTSHHRSSPTRRP
jgi:hypothetical protein